MRGGGYPDLRPPTAVDDLYQTSRRSLVHVFSMEWQSISTAPFDRDLELAVIDCDGLHALVFPCRRILGGWVKSASNETLEVHPSHWREWEPRLSEQ